MKEKLEFLEKFYELRNRTGKIHLFFSINKVIGRLEKSVELEEVYVSKEYLSYLSEKIFSNKHRILEFFNGKNNYIRLSLIKELLFDYDRDIVKEIQEDFMEIKQYNSSIFSQVRKKLEKIMASEDKKIEMEDYILFENYLDNWKRLEGKIKAFIPEEYYGRKNNYFYTILFSYVKYFQKYEENYKISKNFLEKK